jgi:hypothetical protein
MTLILHLGAPKCGSSALQTALSAHPKMPLNDGRVIRYGIIRPDGRVRRITRRDAKATVTGYRVSATAAELAQAGITALTGSRPASNETLILSHEDWLLHPFTLPELAAAFDKDITVVVYLRPQPGWWNSAWWQWWAWTDLDFEKCFKINPAWSKALSVWKKRLPQARFRFRVLPGDVVRDFYENVLEAPQPHGLEVLSNRGLPSVLLRLYQRNRVLRPGPDDHMIDFILSRRLNLQGPSPWVLGPGRISRMLARNAGENRRLQAMLDPDAAETMEADERWWRLRAYGHLRAEPHQPGEIDAAALADLHRHLSMASRRLIRPVSSPQDPAETEAECVEMILKMKRQQSA